VTVSGRPANRGAAASAFSRVFPSLLALAGVSIAAGAAWRGDGEAVLSGLAAAEAPQVPPDFTHADHEDVQCVTCHTNTSGHGTLAVATIDDCRSCHHSAPLSAPCARCHTTADAPEESFPVVRDLTFSVGTRDQRRTLSFPHDRHADIDCARCHTQGVALAAPADLDCAGCHEDHHTAESECASCHLAAPVTAHPPTEAHVTCSGAACHQSVPFETIPRTRAFCLGCHQDQGQHEAPRACAECHALPAPTPQTGALP
jgi:hypothetical protein